ncbi:hypothetical protein EV641_10870 [Rhodococcus sp. SMB37]|nr:hypothetical protein EV641_10870 [Rhodococcus sp. SMB37]
MLGASQIGGVAPDGHIRVDATDSPDDAWIQVAVSRSCGQGGNRGAVRNRPSAEPDQSGFLTVAGPEQFLS